MKNSNLIKLILCLFMISFICQVKAQQSTEELINLLVSKSIIKQNEADSLRASLAIKAQEDKAKQKKFNTTSGKAINIGGYTQVRYQCLQEPTKKDGWDIRRARLDIKGAINERWEYRLQPDFAGSPKIIDAMITYKQAEWLKVTAGQFKLPLSLENIISSNKLETIDLSQVVEALASRSKDIIGNHNGNDIGLQVSGSFVKIKDLNLIDYSFGVFNGQGINTADLNESKDVCSRLVFHPIKGLDLGGSYYTGYDVFGTPTAKQQVRKRYEGDLNFVFKSFFVRGEYMSGIDGSTIRKGWYAEAGYYIIPNKLQIVFKYDTYDPNIDKDENISTYYVPGINYFFNENTKIQLNYIGKKEETEDTQKRNDAIIVQLQTGF